MTSCNGKYHSLSGTGRPVNVACIRRHVKRCVRARSHRKETKMKRTLILLTICAVFLTGCATKIVTEQAELPTAKYDSAFLAVKDVDEPTRLVEIAADVQAAEQAEEEAAADDEWTETYAEYDGGWVESYEPSYSGDGFMQEGVRDYNGRTESWYSSQTLYHYRTNEWSVDDEGYYRDDEGRYVVAASDVPEGTEIETSKGTGIVLDSGCDEGVTDFYVAW